MCHLAYTFYENDNRVLRYAEELARGGDAVDVIALRRPGQPRVETCKGVQIRRIQRRRINETHPCQCLGKLLWFTLKSALLLAVMQRRGRYHVVHVHNLPTFLVFAALAPKLLGARVVLDVHDLDAELYEAKFHAARNSLPVRMLLLMERWSCRFADHVIVANHLWQAKLASRSGARGKCSTILNYPDLDVFKPLGKPRGRNAFIMLYPGTLNHHQGVDIAVKAFGLVKDQMPDAELHIYGEGPARHQIERLVAAYGLETRVKLLPRVPLRQVPEVMATADVGLEPKRGDGFGNEALSTKILEFMACGVPVIASRTLAHSEYLDPSLLQFFAPGDERSLAGQLLCRYRGRSGIDAQVRKAQVFATRHGWHRHAEEYRALIASLAEAAGTDAAPPRRSGGTERSPLDPVSAGPRA